jgi:hypothetical protein
MTTPPTEPTDSEMMDLLCRMVVEVRVPLRYGSRHLFTASPTDNEGDDDTPSDLREQLKSAMNGDTPVSPDNSNANYGK